MEKYKLQPYQAQGIVGNLVQESGLRTSARNRGDGRDGSDSVGIAQWNGNRARNLYGYAKANGLDAGHLDTQLDFMMHEMNGQDGKFGAGSERGAYNALMKSQDLAGATSAFIGFERPAGWSAENPTAGHGYKNRLAFAGQLAGLSPEEIAAAQPTSQRLPDAHTARATAGASVGATGDATASVDVAKAEDSKWKMPQLFPDKVMGVDTKKGFNVLGAMTDLMAKQDQANNAQIQQTAQAAQARRGSSQPVEIVQQATPLFGAVEGLQRASGPNPAEIEELKKKMLMARLGGLGGLGGFGRV